MYGRICFITCLLYTSDSRFGQYAGGKKLALDEAPILLPKHLDDIAKSLKPVPGKPLHFKLATHMENTIDGELQPFFEIHDSRYMMYWLALGEIDYKAYMQNLADEEKARQALEARTVDKAVSYTHLDVYKRQVLRASVMR